MICIKQFMLSFDDEDGVADCLRQSWGGMEMS